MMARRQVRLRAQQPVAAGVGAAPFAAALVVVAFVELAQHIGAHVRTPVVQLFLELVFDHLALLFHDQDLLQALREVAGDGGFQRPHHIDLVQADAQAAAGVVVQTQVVQRLAGVVPGLAAGDDAEAVVGRGNHVVVQTVGPHIGQRRVPLVVHHAGFLIQRRIGPADVQTAVGHREVFGQQNLHPVRIHADAAGRLHDLLDRLQAGPQAGEPAHGEGMQAHVQDVLHAGREEDREADRLEDVVALVGRGGALRDVVVTSDGDDAPMPGGAGHVGMLEHVDAAVHAGALAIPHAEDAIELLLLGEEVELLRAPHGGGAEFFVHARLEDDVLLGQMLAGGHQRLVVAAQRGAAIAGDEAGGVQAGHGVPGALQHGQAHQGLDAAHEGTALVQRVFVVQADCFQCSQDVFGQGGIHEGCLLLVAGTVRSRL